MKTQKTGVWGAVALSGVALCGLIVSGLVGCRRAPRSQEAQAEPAVVAEREKASASESVEIARAQPAAPVEPSEPVQGAGTPPQAAAVRAMYSVVGVAADDVLNVRSQPDPSSEVVGTFAPNVRGVSVLSEPVHVGRSLWVRARLDHTEGWVNSLYLARSDGGGQPSAKGAAGAGAPDMSQLVKLVCFGTSEPWSLRFSATGEAAWGGGVETPGGQRVQSITYGSDGSPSGLRIVDSGGKPSLSVELRHDNQCSDGMADMLYPYTFQSKGALGKRDGCCRIAK